jgi:uncharacterized protein (DUF427 family)
MIMNRPRPERPGPGQESVWDYPRPPRLEATARRLRVIFNGKVIADSTRALRTVENVCVEHLHEEEGASTYCEWKGRAVYFGIEVDGQLAARAAWTYPEPTLRFSALRGHVAFYPQKMEACFVDDEEVRPQPGQFYGGWITSDLVGPFKGEPGTEGW